MYTTGETLTSTSTTKPATSGSRRLSRRATRLVVACLPKSRASSTRTPTGGSSRRTAGAPRPNTKPTTATPAATSATANPRVVSRGTIWLRSRISATVRRSTERRCRSISDRRRRTSSSTPPFRRAETSRSRAARPRSSTSSAVRTRKTPVTGRKRPFCRHYSIAATPCRSRSAITTHTKSSSTSPVRSAGYSAKRSGGTNRRRSDSTLAHRRPTVASTPRRRNGV